MDREYDRIMDSCKAHESCMTGIRQLLLIAELQRSHDDFKNLISTYADIEEIASSLGESARVLNNLE
jgi:hypothetical protein